MGNIYFPNTSYYYDEGAKSGGCGMSANSPWGGGEWYSNGGAIGSFVRFDEDSFIYTGDMNELAQLTCASSQTRCGSYHAGEVDSATQAALEPLIREKFIEWWYENGNADDVEQCKTQSAGSDAEAPSVTIDIDEVYLGMARVEYPDRTSMVYTLGIVIDDIEDAIIQCGANTYHLVTE